MVVRHQCDVPTSAGHTVIAKDNVLVNQCMYLSIWGDGGWTPWPQLTLKSLRKKKSYLYGTRDFVEHLDHKIKLARRKAIQTAL